MPAEIGDDRADARIEQAHRLDHDVRRDPRRHLPGPIAEREAWKLAAEAGAEPRLAVVNPGAIIGPALSDDVSFSLQLIERLLKGMPAVPRLGFSFVDVRDVADLQIRAMTAPEASGQRLIAVGEFAWM